MNPEVSVIIPTYNSELYLAQALKSVLNQSYHCLEVILIDDASIDSTVQIARSFRDPRLSIYQNNRNRGVSYSRNRGIRKAQGKWIALLDSDDWYAPRRLEKLLTVAEARNADLVADDLSLINEHEAQPWSTLLSESWQNHFPLVSTIDAVKFAKSDRLSEINAKQTWSWGYLKPLIRRDFLIENYLKYDETIKVGEDFILYLECLRQQAKFYLVAQPYYYYRTRISSLSTRKPTEYLSSSCAITSSFIDRTASFATEFRLLEVLLENLTIFQKRLEYYRLIEKIKDKKFLAGIKHGIDHPYLLPDLTKKSIMILKKQLEAITQIPNISKQSVALGKTSASIR
ncbi:MAG: glycosyltransferase [Cyanobacteria bacterium P01_G01_bin.39]